MSQIRFALLFCMIGISVTKISAQEITMFPGFFKTQYYIDDYKVNKEQIDSTMQTHKVPEMYWNKSKRNMRLAWVSLGVQYSAILYHFFTRFDSGFKLSPLILSVGAGVSAIGFSISAASLRKKAILSYNQVQSDEGLFLHIGQSHNGLGLVLSF